MKSSCAWPKYNEPKGSNIWIILHYKDYPTLAKHNSFITGSYYTVYKDYPTIAKHNSFITGSYLTLYKDYRTLAKHNSFITGSYYTTKITLHYLNTTALLLDHI